MKGITPKKNKKYYKTCNNFNRKLEDKFSEVEKG